MEQYGNISTFNLESVLVQNIKSSHYYIKKALDLDTVLDVIDEIYESCVGAYHTKLQQINDKRDV